jgi:hypothetical protein
VDPRSASPSAPGCRIAVDVGAGDLKAIARGAQLAVELDDEDLAALMAKLGEAYEAAEGDP